MKLWKKTKRGEENVSEAQTSLLDGSSAPVSEAVEPGVVEVSTLLARPMPLEDEMWRAADVVADGGEPLNEWRVAEHYGINVTPEQIKITRYFDPSTPMFLVWLRVIFAALATARYRAQALASDLDAVNATFIRQDDEARRSARILESATAQATASAQKALTATLRWREATLRAEQAEAAAAEARALVLEMEMDAEQHRAALALSAHATMEREVKIADLTRRLEIAESAVATAAEVAISSASTAVDMYKTLESAVEGDTLASARTALHLGLERGESSTCPCCSQTVAAYRRYLHAGQVLWLLDLVKAWRAAGGTPETWIHKSEIAAVGNDYGFLAYFTPTGREEGLARSAPRELGSAFTGRWQPTEAGLAWLRGEVKAPSHAMVFNRRVLSSAAEGVTVEEALGERFDYSAVMPAFDAAKRA